MSSLTDLADRFIACEVRERFFLEKIRGRVVWNYLRYAVFETMILKDTVRANETPRASKGDLYVSYRMPIGTKLRLLLKEALGFLRYLLRWIARPRVQGGYDILVINYDRKIFLDDKLVNIQFYLFVKALSDRYRILLVDPSRYQEEVEAHYPCEVFRSRLLYYGIKLKARFLRYTPGEKQILKKFQKALEAEFKGEVPIEWLAKESVSFQLASIPAYRRLFKKIRPKIIIHANTGNNQGWIEVAHELGIPVVDCQHSLMSPINILYRYPEESLQYGLKALSDHIFTFGEFWHRQYHLPAKLTAVGFPFLEIKRDEINRLNIPKSKSLIIISSMTSRRKLEEVAIVLARSLPDYEVIYKLRPDEYAGWREVYSRAFRFQPNLKIVDSNATSLYHYFAKCRYQLGVNSTALIEGMAFNLETFILKDGWYLEMQPLVDQGMARLVESAEEIVQTIQGYREEKRSFDADRLFRSGSLVNIRNEIGALLN